MLDVLLFILIAASIPMILYRPWTGVLVWSWISFMNPHRFGWGWLQTMPVAMMVGGATLLAVLFARDKKRLPGSGETALLILLTLHFTFTTFFAWTPDNAWEQWGKVMKILLMTFVGMMMIYGKDRIRALVYVAVLSLGYFGFKGGIFSILHGGNYTIWGPPGSFIEDNNALGLALIMILPLLLLMSREASRKWVRLALLGGFFLCVMSIIFTYSRGALLGLVSVSLLLFLTLKRKVAILALLIPALVVGVGFIPDKYFKRQSTISTYQQDDSAMQRIQAWGVCWNVAKDYPLTGAGFGLEATPSPRWLSYTNFMGQWENKARSAHSIYFQMLGDHGMVGLALFVSLILISMRNLSRIKKRALDDPALEWVGKYAAAIQVGLVGYMVSGAFLNLAYFDLFYLYVALTAILGRELKLADETNGLAGGAKPLPAMVINRTR